MDARLRELVDKYPLTEDDIKYIRSMPFDWDFWTARAAYGFVRDDAKVRALDEMSGEGTISVNRPKDYAVEHPTND